MFIRYKAIYIHSRLVLRNKELHWSMSGGNWVIRIQVTKQLSSRKS